MSDTSTNHDAPETYPAVDLETPHLTLRAVLTGSILGGILSVTNIYAGLKIGWGFNMSIAAALIGYGIWQGIGHHMLGRRSYNVLENNVAQTGASAAASISSAGLVSAVPALTMITGFEWTWPVLALWLLCCSVLGVFIAMLFRRQMLVQEKLPFASGVATAETLREMYAKGAEAMARLKALIGGALGAAALKVTGIFLEWHPYNFGGSFSASSSTALATKGVVAVSPYNLTFALDPSLLLFGSGIIVGVRTGIWMLVGAIVAWGVVGFDILGTGAVEAGKPEAAWFKQMVGWLLWPGVAMLVTSSLTALAFSAPAFINAFRGGRKLGRLVADPREELSTRTVWVGLFVIGLVTVVVSAAVFDMDPGISALAVALTGLLAVVALRVSGETNITPVGAMGKVTQLTFGLVDPGNVATNLMAANITGGSSSQAADMMHDLKTGLLLGCSPRSQFVSQLAGVVTGALVGAAAYLVLVPDPVNMLITTEWPAPAVAQWKSVAEVMRGGLEALPMGVLDAIYLAAGIGVILAIIEKISPKGVRKWVPSPTAIGIAFCIPAWNSMSMFMGGVVGYAIKKSAPAWHVRFAVVIAAGLIVGESLVGLVDALMKLL